MVVLHRDGVEFLLGRAILVHVALGEQGEHAGERESGRLFVPTVGRAREDSRHRVRIESGFGRTLLDATDQRDLGDPRLDGLNGVLERIRRHRKRVLESLTGYPMQPEVRRERWHEVRVVLGLLRL
jgi:hypothetical protein